jgi:4'-phosphopantetheinyl transferase
LIVREAEAQNLEFQWPERNVAPELLPGQVHVWSASLNPSSEEFETYSEILSRDEKQRAERFRFPVHRNRFIAGRGVLREMLGEYLEIFPGDIEFRYSEHGKPFLKAPPNAEKLAFNLSHTGDVALLAFGFTPEIGVDIEQLRPMPDREDIAKRFFAPAEAATLSFLPPYEQDAAFFRCWTRKEAFLKARGEGIFHGLKNFEVSVLPDEPPRILKILDAEDEAAAWSLHELEPCPGFTGALAVRQPQATVLMFHFRQE